MVFYFIFVNELKNHYVSHEQIFRELCDRNFVFWLTAKKSSFSKNIIFSFCLCCTIIEEIFRHEDNS